MFVAFSGILMYFDTSVFSHALWDTYYVAIFYFHFESCRFSSDFEILRILS